MRGEHQPTDPLPRAKQGSSPHARGTPSGTQLVTADSGIIPACAGNTCGMVHGRAQIRDHPRMRGEHVRGLYFYAMVGGSSPHARGTHSGKILRRVCFGIIPACAGNTDPAHGPVPAPVDHPRMRGEHWLTCCMLGTSPGSSPHARGTRAMLAMPGCIPGIIPACAGNTSH